MLLGPDDPLPRAGRRVLMAGGSGSGKTTLAGTLGLLWDLPHTELDALHHGPGWQPRAEFLEDVRRLAASERWITEWQYDAARPILLERADLVVWLDLPRHVVMRQVLTRTVTRRLRGTELWNGNREGPLLGVLTDPEHVIRWAWSTHAAMAERAAQIVAERPQLPVVRLRSRAEVARWLTAPVGTRERPR